MCTFVLQWLSLLKNFIQKSKNQSSAEGHILPTLYRGFAAVANSEDVPDWKSGGTFISQKKFLHHLWFLFSLSLFSDVSRTLSNIYGKVFCKSSLLSLTIFAKSCILKIFDRVLDTPLLIKKRNFSIFNLKSFSNRK